MRNFLSDRRLVLLVGIMLVGLLLRLWGIGFGLPYEYHVDEVQYVRQAASMGERGLEPTWWNNPPFYKYILLAEYAGLFVIGKITGVYVSASDFGRQKTFDPTDLYLLGRITSALIGTLTVLVVYWLGNIAYNWRVGLLAAWFIAVGFIHVRDSHYATNDIALTFIVTIALLAAVKITQTGIIKWYVIGGFALGLGFATKYTAIFALAPLLIAHLFSPDVQFRQLRLHKFMVIPGMAALTAIIASPYFVLTPSKVIQDVYKALILAGRHGFDGWEIDPSGGYVFYVNSLAWGLGTALLSLVLVGLAVAILRHSPKDLILLSIPLLMYALLGQQKMYFARFILPILPPLLVLGASLMEKVVSSFIVSKNGIAVGLTMGALLVTAQPLANGFRHGDLLTQSDTRTLAKVWIESNIPEGIKIAVDWPVHGPPLATPDKSVPMSQRVYNVMIVGGAGLSEYDLAWYRQQGFEYLIASSFIYDISLLDKRRDAERRAFYTLLDRELTLVAEFKPYQGNEKPPFIFDEIYGPAVSLWKRERPGPILKVYRVNER